MRRLPLLTLAAIGALAPGLASADVVTTFGNTTGTGPWDLTSTATTYSGIDVALSSPITFNTLSTLSATFTDISGGADVGSPRIVLFATNNSDFFTVYLGTPPNFNDSVPSTFTTKFSGTNLNNASSNSAYQNSGSYVTLASLMANPSYSSDSIGFIDFDLDGGYGANGTQELTLNSLNVDGQVYNTSAVPEPTSLALLGAGLIGFGWLGRRPRKTA